MKFNVERDVLINGLNTIGRAVSSKSVQPALQGVYMETKDNKLILRGSDIDISIETLIDAEISNPGKLLIDNKLLSEVIKKLPNNTVSIDNERQEGQVEITCQKSQFSIMTLNCDEYPNFPSTAKKNVSFNINSTTLKDLINSTIYAVAVDDTRPILKGLLVEVKSSILTLVGLDGYRLAKKSLSVEIDKDFEVVVEARHLGEISKLLSSGNIKVDITDNHILFDINNTQIICRLLEGNFINYKTLINDNTKFSIDLIGSDFYQALERATLISKGTNNQAFLTIDYRRETLIISSKSNMGNSVEEIPISINRCSEDFEIAFNVRYLIDVFKYNSDEEFTLKFNSSITPCLIQGKGNELETFLVLPIRLLK